MRQQNPGLKIIDSVNYLFSKNHLADYEPDYLKAVNLTNYHELGYLRILEELHDIEQITYVSHPGDRLVRNTLYYLKNWPEIRSLNLSNNPELAGLELDFSFLQKLIMIDLSNCQLKQMPKLPNSIEELNLQRNFYLDKIDLRTLLKLKKLSFDFDFNAELKAKTLIHNRYLRH